MEKVVTKSAQEPYCGFERHYILIECGYENTLLSGRVVYILRSL
jgi:hypothetical protein